MQCGDSSTVVVTSRYVICLILGMRHACKAAPCTGVHAHFTHAVDMLHLVHQSASIGYMHAVLALCMWHADCAHVCMVCAYSSSP